MFGFGKKDKQPQVAVAAPQHLTIDLTGHGQTYDDITTPEQRDAAFRQGRLERFPIIAERFGGPLEEMNFLYGPPGCAAAKAHVDDEIQAAIERGMEVSLGADVDYADGDSRVPHGIRFDLGALGVRELRFW